MEWHQIAWVAIAVAFAVLVYNISRLSRRLEKSLDKVDTLVVTTERQLDLTMEQAQHALREVSDVGQNVNDQMKRLESVLDVTQGVMQNIRFTTLAVQKVLVSPLANVSGIVAGVSRGIGTLGTKKKGERRHE